MVIIKATDNYKVDDIVLFQDGNSLVIHRIIEIDGDTEELDEIKKMIEELKKDK